MKRSTPGQYVVVSTQGEPFKAFVPAPLPPKPPVDWSPALRRQFDAANVALGRLDALSSLLPNAQLLLYSFVRKEAVLSSQIEGTQSSLSDLLLFEADELPGVPLDDAREVSRCVAAMAHGIDRLRGGFPLSLRLLREMHGVLLDQPRGHGKTPGQFRRSQVWIGGTRPGNALFVPPPADRVNDCLDAFERFLHDMPEPTPPLIKAALAHVQFETIHPFLDGNGRIGRLLIVLQLVADGVLREPMLYPSLFFKAHRPEYYRLLNEVRDSGDWEGWLAFFAEAVERSATHAVRVEQELIALVQTDRDRIAALGRAAPSALVVHEALQRTPITTAKALTRDTGITPATVNKTLALLQQAGLVSELTARQRGRVFAYAAYVECIDAELEEPATKPKARKRARQ
jgi:Fic family protein